MGFTIMHLSGAMEANPPDGALEDLLEELADADEDHVDVAVSNEDGWTLSVMANGNLVWENIETLDGPQHLPAPGPEAALALMHAVANGDLDALRRQPWLPGYPS